MQSRHPSYAYVYIHCLIAMNPNKSPVQVSWGLLNESNWDTYYFYYPNCLFFKSVFFFFFNYTRTEVACVTPLSYNTPQREKVDSPKGERSRACRRGRTSTDCPCCCCWLPRLLTWTSIAVSLFSSVAGAALAVSFFPPWVAWPLAASFLSPLDWALCVSFLSPVNWVLATSLPSPVTWALTTGNLTALLGLQPYVKETEFGPTALAEGPALFDMRGEQRIAKVFEAIFFS